MALAARRKIAPKRQVRDYLIVLKITILRNIQVFPIQSINQPRTALQNAQDERCQMQIYRSSTKSKQQ